MKKVIIVLFIIVLADWGMAELRSSISHWGITWTFDKQYEVGQFISDDWWVVGPVTVTKVTPAPSNGRNGSMLNPRTAAQSYDSRASQYQAAYAAKFPLSIQGTNSLVSTISKAADELSYLQSAAVLTVVNQVPPTDAFRPPYIKGEKPFFRASEIQRELLPKLDRSKVPLLNDQLIKDYEDKTDGLWLDHTEDYLNQRIHPAQHMPPYSRDFALRLSNTAVILMLDNQGKDEQLLYHFLQRGIDFYYLTVQNDHLWPANGGHANGRKWPIIFAGIMFDKDEMKRAKFRTNEDEQTYYGTVTTEYPKGIPLFGAACGKPNFCTNTGNKTCRDPNGLRDDCVGYRSCCTSRTWVGAALAGRIMKAEQYWNHDAHFDFVDRHVKVYANSYNDYGGAIINLAWNAFRANAPYIDPNQVRGSLSFFLSFDTGAPPLAVTFTNTSSDKYTAWKWEFGDGATSTEKSPTHTYTQFGIYTATLTATGPNGSESFQDVITVKLQDIIIEAESMLLNGYLVDTHPSIYGTAILIDYANTTTGTATASFTGASGTYDIVISTIPENDGTPTVRLFVAGVKILEEILPTDPSYYTLSARLDYTITSVSIQNGDEIKIEGVLDVGANARVDKITFRSTTVQGINKHLFLNDKQSRFNLMRINPVQGKLSIYVSRHPGAELKIYTTTGREVMYSGKELDAGMYLYHLTDGDEVLTGRFLKID